MNFAFTERECMHPVYCSQLFSYVSYDLDTKKKLLCTVIVIIKSLVCTAYVKYYKLSSENCKLSMATNTYRGFDLTKLQLCCAFQFFPVRYTSLTLSQYKPYSNRLPSFRWLNHSLAIDEEQHRFEGSQDQSPLYHDFDKPKL